MLKFTAGPWMVVYDATRHLRKIVKADNPGITIGHASAMDVSAVEAADNAVLMALAPQLAAELNILVEQLEAEGTEIDLSGARAALEKFK